MPSNAVRRVLGRLSRVFRSLLGRSAPALSPEQYWDSKYQVDDFIYTKVPNRFIVELCSSITPGKAIDLAGGEGRNTIWLAEQGWQVENVDISRRGLDKCLAFAAERGVTDRVKVLQASGEGFRSSLAPVDMAIVPYLQIPAQQLEASLVNLVSQVRRGGILVGVWHSLDNLAGGFGGPQDPAVLPSVASMRAICERIGLKIAICENRDGQVQTKDGLKPSITLVLKAEVL